MTSTAIPKILDYKSVKPRGIQTEYKTMRFTPLTSFNSYITNDIVRFWIPQIRGFWDPYKSYIQIEVQVSGTDFPYGCGVQVDNSASSFINQMTVYVDSQQIERIQQYDTIAATLHDIMYQPSDQFGKQYEGSGYGSHTSLGTSVDTRKMCSAIAAGKRPVREEQWGIGAAQPGVQGGAAEFGYTDVSMYVSGYLPEHPMYITPRRVTYPIVHFWTQQTSLGNNVVTNPSQGTAPTGVAVMSFPQFIPSRLITNGGQVNTAESCINNVNVKSHPYAWQLLPHFVNLNQYQYISQAGVNAFQFSQTNMAAGRPWLQSHLQSSMYGLQGTTANNFNIYGPQAFATHATTYPGSFTNVCNVQTFPGYTASTVKTSGYSQAFSQELSNGSYQTLFAPLHPQTWIHNGKFLEQPLKTVQRVFQIPIISSIFGVLIPAQSYKLLPMTAFKNLMLQFRLNQYAMFTSGYKVDYTANSALFDRIPQSQMLQRQWKINKFQIWGAIYQFDDFVNNMTDSMLASGITLCSSGWNIGPRFSLSNTSLIQNSWQINAGYQSLRTLCFRIQSDDYKKWTFCRQHYYYSANVTSLQLKIANTYIPPQPIQGHAGNIMPYLNQKSNAPYIIELHKTFGKLFNIGSNMYINATNFAVNDRPYDPSNVLPYRDAQGDVQNIDTAHGLPLFHQNRCVGRCLYAFDLQAIPGQPEVISGLDTTQYRPFQIVIDSETPALTARDSTLVFILNYDVIYVLQGDQPPEVFGRGSS